MFFKFLHSTEPTAAGSTGPPPPPPPPKKTKAPDGPSPPVESRFKVVANSQAEEDAYDATAARNLAKPTNVIGAIAHLVKGALGGGILGGHVAYMKAGVWMAVPFNILFGLYMAYCLHLLVMSAQILYKRTRIHTMSYPDVGEASVACFPNPKVQRFAKAFRYCIDSLICIDLFGACATYQLIISKTIKQMVENTQTTSIEGVGNLPSLRIYMLCMIIPIILICLITQLKYLAPFSIVANVVILFAIIMAIRYCFVNNPTFQNMTAVTNMWNFFEYSGMCVFSMSCAGVVIPVENNMANPKRFDFVLTIGMALTVVGLFAVSFFGYAAYLDDSESPITVNFPLDIVGKIFKGCVGAMIYVTHALNFWPPFNIVFHYLKKCHDESKHFRMELVYRAVFVTCISIVAIIFPDIDALMGFLGTFCLSNMAFIWPNVINLLVIWERPGLGKYRWKLWRSVVLITIGVFIFFCGSVVNIAGLVNTFRKMFGGGDETQTTPTTSTTPTTPAPA